MHGILSYQAVTSWGRFFMISILSMSHRQILIKNMRGLVLPHQFEPSDHSSGLDNWESDSLEKINMKRD